MAINNFENMNKKKVKNKIIVIINILSYPHLSNTVFAFSPFLARLDYFFYKNYNIQHEKKNLEYRSILSQWLKSELIMIIMIIIITIFKFKN